MFADVEMVVIRDGKRNPDTITTQNDLIFWDDNRAAVMYADGFPLAVWNPPATSDRVVVNNDPCPQEVSKMRHMVRLAASKDSVSVHFTKLGVMLEKFGLATPENPAEGVARAIIGGYLQVLDVVPDKWKAEVLPHSEMGWLPFPEKAEWLHPATVLWGGMDLQGRMFWLICNKDGAVVRLNKSARSLQDLPPTVSVQ